LEQLKEAGLSANSADDVISEDEKMQLLGHLRKRHGKAEGGTGNSPRRVTLERRKVMEIKQATAPGSSTKTISVEVRKKKTYIKRPETVESEDSKSVELIHHSDEEVEQVKALDPSVMVPVATEEVSNADHVSSEVEPEVVSEPTSATSTAEVYELSVEESITTELEADAEPAPEPVSKVKPESIEKEDDSVYEDHVAPLLELDIDLDSDPEEKFATVKVKEDKKIKQDKPVKAKESDEARKNFRRKSGVLKSRLKKCR